MLRIGDFARLGGVTVRALRHYEARGLLAPAAVDAETGYRLYRTEQLEALDRIIALRDLGFSLGEVGELSGGTPEAILERLSRQRRRLTLDVQMQTARLRRLVALEQAAGSGSAEMSFRLRVIAPQRALTRRTKLPSSGGSVTALFEEAEMTAARERIDRSPFLLLHGTRDVEVCIPVRPSCRLPGTREVPGSPLAGTLTYSGGYEKTPKLARRLERWLARSGLRAHGPLREVYHRFGAGQRGYALPQRRLAVAPAGYVTELQLPAEEDA
jgi:DNA-binding transcriptional MerR regulator